MYILMNNVLQYCSRAKKKLKKMIHYGAGDTKTRWGWRCRVMVSI